MNRYSKIAVSEYFYSLQGEGRTMGIPAVFLRLTGCNLMCGGYGVEKDGKLRDGATWVCDTIAVWMKGETYSFEALVAEMNQKINFIKRLKEGVHLVITGGEPLLQQARIVSFLEYLDRTHHLQPIVEIETNATLTPLDALDQRVEYWNVSPKLTNSGMPQQDRLNKSTLQWFNENDKTMFKFVVVDTTDADEIINEYINELSLDKSKIILMPAACSLEELLVKNKAIAAICMQHQLRMCTRLHVEVWDQLTGV